MRQRPQPPLTRRERRQIERLERLARERGPATGRRASRPAWQSPFVLVSVLALVAAGAVITLSQRPASAPYVGELISPPVVYSAESVDRETLGRADAPVVLEVWSDFQCPVCARFVREQFGMLKAQFVDTGALRIEARDIAILGSGDRDESLELATGRPVPPGRTATGSSTTSSSGTWAGRIAVTTTPNS